MDEKELYYAVIYTPCTVSEHMNTYIPIGVAEGYYDPETRVLKSTHTNREYEMLDSGILHLEDCKNVDVDGLDKDVAALYRNGLFIAFPIKVSEYKEKFASDIEDNKKLAEEQGQNPMTEPAIYLKCSRYYNLFSVYSNPDQLNVFYMFDGDSRTLLEVQDLGTDLDGALDAADAQQTMQSQQRVPVFTVEIPALTYIAEILREYFGNGEEASANEEPAEEENENKALAEDELLLPSQVKLDPFDFDPDHLEELILQEIIGQDEAVRKLVQAVYDNYRYCMNKPGTRTNIMLLGPSGCGKTEMVESLARHLDVPIAYFDLSSVSKTGLMGNSISLAIRNLIKAAGGDVKKAEHGMIFFDEGDKIGSNSSEYGVQDELLTMLSGKDVTVPAESSFDKSFVFNTGYVTFVTAGAYSSLFEKREKANRQIGFVTSPPQDVYRPVKNEDLKDCGVKPELIGRYETKITIRKLPEDGVYDVLTKSKVSPLLNREESFLVRDNVLVVRDGSYERAVAKKAVEEDVGARGLKTVVQNTLGVASRKIRLLNGEGGTLVITEATVEDPYNFELYKLDGTKVYGPPSKENGHTKKIGTYPNGS